MRRWSMSCISNRRQKMRNAECGMRNVQSAIHIPKSTLTFSLFMGLLLWSWSAQATAALTAKTPDREPITMSVVAVNPSAEKTQVVPVKIELPQEVAPNDILETGELKLEYSEDRKAYYVYKEAVALAPKETRVFQVVVRDIWFIPQGELDSLRGYTLLLLGRLEKSEYFATAKELAATIIKRLDGIQTTQNDESLSRKSRIGAYRYHLQTLAEIKEDLARMEKLLAFIGGPPVPDILTESALKSDAPSQTTTWLVIFLIIIFVGLLGGQFFMTWHRRAQTTQDLALVRQVAFPPSQRMPAKEASPKNADGR